MEEMIERCARALAARHYAERFAKAKDDPHVQMNVDGNWNIFAEDARTVIEAMRLPTDVMIESADSNVRPDSDNLQCPDWYTAAIDAALSTPLASEGGTK